MPTIAPAGGLNSAMHSSASPSATPANPASRFNGRRSNFEQTALNQVSQPFSAAIPHFGLLGPFNLAGLAQNMMYAIEHTSYGNILVVDNGIVLGRAHAANKRSGYEAVEVVFRDVVSLYFYMLFAPHVMKAFSSVLNPVFQTHLQLQPKVTEELTRAISENLTNRVEQWMRQEQDAARRSAMQAAFQRGAVPKEFIREILLGSQNPLLMEPAETLKKAMGSAPLTGPQGLTQLFQQELRTYGWPEDQQAHWEKQIQRFMRHSSPLHWNSTEMESLLAAVQQGHSYFSGLTEPQRKEVVVALKNAFRHSAGIRVDLSGKTLTLNGQPMEQTPAFNEIWPQLTTEERAALTGRIRRMAEIDALDQASTLWRRSLNLLREHVGESSALMTQAEQLASFIDRAVSHHMTLSELLEQDLAVLKNSLLQKGLILADETLTPEKLKTLSYSLNLQQGTRKLAKQAEALNTLLGEVPGNASLTTHLAGRAEGLMDEMLRSVKASANSRSILEQYRKMLHERLQGGRGTLFTLSVAENDALLDAKLKELLVGGLQNDSRFLAKLQNLVGDLNTDRRNFKNTSKLQKLRTSIDQYGEKLTNYLERESVTQVKPLPQLVFWGKAGGPAEIFQKLNRNLNYMGRTLSMGGAMLCLGLLVPKMQYLITRKLTGRDENPGISSAERNLGIQRAEKKAISA